MEGQKRKDCNTSRQAAIQVRPEIVTFNVNVFLIIGTFPKSTSTQIGLSVGLMEVV